MTEAEWLACADPTPMFDLLSVAASDRKLRLFGVACCRQVEEHLWAGSSTSKAILTAELYADLLTSAEALAAAQHAVENCLELYPGEPVYDASYWACSGAMTGAAWQCSFYAANCSTRPFDGKGVESDVRAREARTSTLRAQAYLLRDIQGRRTMNP